LRLVIKIGGFAFPCDLNTKILKTYASTIEKLYEEGHRLVVVTGGGEVARKYISAARELGASESLCDLLGIEVSRINARLLIAALGGCAYPEPPESLKDVIRAILISNIVVVGGFQPGQSTNAVAALSAEAMPADLFINATDVDGVYTSDPKKHPEAKKLDVISASELIGLMLRGEVTAGSYELLDPLAVKIIGRSGINTRIIDGRNPENVERVVRGEPLGTLIVAK
jgi:uridylate kinase